MEATCTLVRPLPGSEPGAGPPAGAKYAHASGGREHVVVFNPNCVLVRPVIVDLRVVLEAVDGRTRPHREVVDRPWEVGKRKITLNFQGGRAEICCGYNAARKECASGCRRQSR